MQDVKSLSIPEGNVKTIHDKDNKLLWSAVGYGVTYKGDTTQQTYSGKNLAPVIDSSDSMNGLTLSASNGGLSITGTSSAATTFTVFNGVIYKQAYYQGITANATNSILLEAGTYTFSGNKTQTDCSAIGVLVDLGNNYGSGTAISPGSTFTITEQKWFGFFVYVGDNKTPKLTFDDIMIEKSATSTPYEPYVGSTPTQITPSPNPDYSQNVNVATGVQTITITGKNLCSNPLEYGIYDMNGQKSGSDTGSVRSTSQIPVSPSTQYRFSCNGSGISTWIYEYDINGNFIAGTRRIVSSVSFTTGNATHFITFYKGSNTGLNGYQLERGGTITQYEAHQSQNFTIDLGSTELCKIGTYQDYIYKNNGNWYAHKECGKTVYTGDQSELWVNGSYGTNSFYISLPDRLVPSDTSPNYNYSNLFRGVAYSERTTAGNNIIYNDPVSGLYIRNTNFTSLNDFKTALSTTNLISYYALATPTDTQITDNAFISQLDAIHQWLTRYGYNATVSGNLPIVIDRTNL